MFCFILVPVAVFPYLKCRWKLLKRQISTGILFVHTAGSDPRWRNPLEWVIAQLKTKMASQPEIQSETKESLKSKPSGLCILHLFYFFVWLWSYLWSYIFHILLPTPLCTLNQLHINENRNDHTHCKCRWHSPQCI